MEWLSAKVLESVSRETFQSAAYLFVSLSVYVIVKHLAPVVAERYRERTRHLRERDVARADVALDKLNGKFAEMVRYAIKELKDSVEFQELVDRRVTHKIGPFSEEIGSLRERFKDHEQEGHEYIRKIDRLEVEQGHLRTEVKELARDFKNGYSMLVRIGAKLGIEEKR